MEGNELIFSIRFKDLDTHLLYYIRVYASYHRMKEIVHITSGESRTIFKHNITGLTVFHPTSDSFYSPLVSSFL
jgi:hypothetical protein